MVRAHSWRDTRAAPARVAERTAASRSLTGIDFGALSSSALSLTTVNDYQVRSADAPWRDFASDARGDPPRTLQTKNFKILTYILAAATGLVLLLTLLMIPRLRVAAACIKARRRP